MRAYILPNKQIPLLDTSGNKAGKQQETKPLSKQYSIIKDMSDTNIPRISVTGEGIYTLTSPSPITIISGKLYNAEILAYTSDIDFDIVNISAYGNNNALDIQNNDIILRLEVVNSTNLTIKVLKSLRYFKLVINSIKEFSLIHTSTKLKKPTKILQKVSKVLNAHSLPVKVETTNISNTNDKLLYYLTPQGNSTYSTYTLGLLSSSDKENFNFSELIDIKYSPLISTLPKYILNGTYIFITGSEGNYGVAKVDGIYVNRVKTNIDSELASSTNIPSITILGPFARISFSIKDSITGSTVYKYYYTKDLETWYDLQDSTHLLRTGTVKHHDNTRIFFETSSSDYIIYSDYSFTNIITTSIPKGGLFASNGTYFYTVKDRLETSGSWQYLYNHVYYTEDFLTSTKYLEYKLSYGYADTITDWYFKPYKIHYSPNINVYYITFKYNTYENGETSTSSYNDGYVLLALFKNSNTYTKINTSSSYTTKIFDFSDRSVISHYYYSSSSSSSNGSDLILVSDSSLTTYSRDSMSSKIYATYNIEYFNNKYYITAATTSNSTSYSTFVSEDLTTLTRENFGLSDSVLILYKYNNKLLIQNVKGIVHLKLYWVLEDHTLTPAKEHYHETFTQEKPYSSNFKTFRFGSWLYRVHGSEYSVTYVEISKDHGITWETANIPKVYGTYFKIVYFKGYYILLTSYSMYNSNTYYSLLKSTDGVNWTLLSSGSHDVKEIIVLDESYLTFICDASLYYAKEEENFATLYEFGDLSTIYASRDYYTYINGMFIGGVNDTNKYAFKKEDVIKLIKGETTSLKKTMFVGGYFETIYAPTPYPCYINGKYFWYGYHGYYNNSSDYITDRYINISEDLINWNSIQVSNDYARHAFNKGILYRYNYSSSSSQPPAYSYDGESWIDITYNGEPLPGISSIAFTANSVLFTKSATEIYEFFPDTCEVKLLTSSPTDYILTDSGLTLGFEITTKYGYFNPHYDYSNSFIKTKAVPKIIPSNSLTINEITIKGTNVGITYNGSPTNIQEGTFNQVAYIYNFWVVSGPSGTFLSPDGISWSKFTDKQLRGYSNNTLIFLDGYSYTFSPLGGYTEVL